MLRDTRVRRSHSLRRLQFRCPCRGLEHAVGCTTQYVPSNRKSCHGHRANKKRRNDSSRQNELDEQFGACILAPFDIVHHTTPERFGITIRRPATPSNDSIRPNRSITPTEPRHQVDSVGQTITSKGSPTTEVLCGADLRTDGLRSCVADLPARVTASK